MGVLRSYAHGQCWRSPGYTFAKQGILALLVMHRDAQVPIDGVANRRCCGTNTVHVLLQGGCTRVPVMGKWLV